MVPLVSSIPTVRVNTGLSGFTGGSTNVRLTAAYSPVQDINRRRTGYPDDIMIVFDDQVVDTSIATFLFPARPARFRVYALADTDTIQLDFRFRDNDASGTVSAVNERIDVLCPIPGVRVDSLVTWILQYDPTTPAPVSPPRLGDVYHLRLDRPLAEGDVFTFRTRGARVDPASAKSAFANTPYVVPNPYVEAASFEPAPYNVTGRGERRIEFRGLPSTCTVRIYTVRGDLVQTLRHEGSFEGFVPWNLRSKENLEVAPGLYIYHVDAPGIGTHVGKFAIVK
jgi:hypothetical protein